MNLYEIVKRDLQGNEISRFHLLRGFALELRYGQPVRFSPTNGRPYIDRVEPGCVLWEAATGDNPVEHKGKRHAIHVYSRVPALYTDKQVIKVMHTKVKHANGIIVLQGGQDR